MKTMIFKENGPISSMGKMFKEVTELERVKPWTLITKRDGLVKRMMEIFIEMYQEPKRSERKVSVVTSVFSILTIISVLSVFFMHITVMKVPLFVIGGLFTVLYYFEKRIANALVGVKFLSVKNVIIQRIQEQVQEEIAEYEAYIRSQDTEQLLQQDPLLVLTESNDQKYAYMSEDQLKAYWREVELPRRQNELQDRMEKLSHELDYIRKEYALLEEIEKS